MTLKICGFVCTESGIKLGYGPQKQDCLLITKLGPLSCLQLVKTCTNCGNELIQKWIFIPWWVIKSAKKKTSWNFELHLSDTKNPWGTFRLPRETLQIFQAPSPNSLTDCAWVINQTNYSYKLMEFLIILLVLFVEFDLKKLTGVFHFPAAWPHSKLSLFFIGSY